MNRLFFLIFGTLFLGTCGYSAASEDGSQPSWVRVTEFRDYAAQTRQTRVISKETEAESVWNMLSDDESFRVSFSPDGYFKKAHRTDSDDVTDGVTLLKKKINAFSDRGEDHRPDLYGKLINTQILLTGSSSFTPKDLVQTVQADFTNLVSGMAATGGAKPAHLLKVLACQYSVFLHIYEHCDINPDDSKTCVMQ